MDEACDSSDASAVRLFYTCRNVFEMYAGLVPEHHKKFLETIPQQVGKNWSNEKDSDTRQINHRCIY